MGIRGERESRGTTAHSFGRSGRISSDWRGEGVGFPLTSSTTSAADNLTTRYHAPRRKCPSSDGRMRAHCAVAMLPPRVSLYTIGQQQGEGNGRPRWRERVGIEPTEPLAGPKQV